MTTSAEFAAAVDSIAADAPRERAFTSADALTYIDADGNERLTVAGMNAAAQAMIDAKAAAADAARDAAVADINSFSPLGKVYDDEPAARSAAITAGKIVGDQILYKGTDDGTGNKPTVLAQLTSVTSGGASTVVNSSVTPGQMAAEAAERAAGDAANAANIIANTSAINAESAARTAGDALKVDKSVFDPLFSFPALPGYVQSWYDALHRAVGGIRNSGALHFAKAIFNTITSAEVIAKKVAIGTSEQTTDAPAGFLWALMDSAKKVTGGLRTSGLWEFGKARIGTINDVKTTRMTSAAVRVSPAIPATWVLIPVYGQSLALGTGVFSFTHLPVYQGLRFKQKIVSGNLVYDEAVPLTESSWLNTTGNNTESPSSGLGQAMYELLDLDDGIPAATNNVRIFMINPGAGGVAVQALIKGTAPYTKMMTMITAAAALANAAGATLVVPGWLWHQGEGNYANGVIAGYAAALSGLADDFDADVKVITGQPQDVICSTYQVASHKAYSVAYPSIALDQYELARTNPKFTMSSPMYIFDYQSSDHVHLASYWYKVSGAYGAKSLKRKCFDAGASKDFVYVDSYLIQGRVIELTLHVPVAPLVIDTTFVTENTNYGFTLLNASGVDQGALTVAVSGNRVMILSPVAVTTGFTLQYAFYGAGITGRTDGPRGNIRDSAGDYWTFDVGKFTTSIPPTPVLMHNPLPMFEIIF